MRAPASSEPAGSAATMRRRSWPGIAALLVAVALPGPATAGTGCPDVAARAKAPGVDIAALETLRDEVTRLCPLTTLKWVEDRLGRAHFAAARDAGDRDRRLFHLTQASMTLGAQRWRAHAALAEAHQADKVYAAAAEQYQLALVAIQEAPQAAPDRDTVERLLERANATRALAPTYTRSIRTRDGAPGGVAATEIAGVVIEEVPFPVEFPSGSAELTDDGRLAVADLHDIVVAAKARTITLVGHTDPDGSPERNRTLSLERANTVRDALLSMGVRAEIRVRGAGESEPPEFDDPTLYTPEERHRMMRRVVLDRRG